jgi:Na+/proline symporter
LCGDDKGCRLETPESMRSEEKAVKSRLRPKVVIWWGIGVAVGGSLLVLLVPAVLGLFLRGETTVGQEAQGVVEVVLRMASGVLPPLGAALIGAGIVILYIEKNVAGSPRR